MALARVFTLSNVAVRNAVTFHFFKYYAGDDGTPFFWFLDKTSLFLTLGSLAFIIALFFTKPLAAKFGKRNALIGLTVLNALCFIAFFFVPPPTFGIKD